MNYFESKVRDNGTTYYSLKDDAPEWLQEAVQEAHMDCNDLPNDWIYETCSSALEAVIDQNDFDVDTFEIADGLVDIYNSDLFRWAADMHNTYTYDNAKELYLSAGTGCTDELDIIKGIQFYAIQNIVEIMKLAWENNQE